ncbi:MAG TPA: hypothetical protein VK708_06040 [Bryobacteraceae bacterium]|nr:hypothetical protein [Bryobacteraceae bacterium]
MSNELSESCSVIEECYEFMLAFAGQGLPTEAGGRDGLIRDFLSRAAQALAGIENAYASAVKEMALAPAGPYAAFQAVLARDAQDSLAAVELVLAQPAIGSQLIDNLNASIHLRALLTDLFLIDEILKGSQITR